MHKIWKHFLIFTLNENNPLKGIEIEMWLQLESDISTPLANVNYFGFLELK